MAAMLHLLEPSNADPIVNLLATTAMREVSDKRDRWYSILSLLPPSVGIIPDYEASVDKIFIDCTTRVIAWSKSIDILRIAGLASSGPTSMMPTWVPDLIDGKALPIIPDGYGHFQDSLPARVRPCGDAELGVYGLKLGRVVDCEACVVPSSESELEFALLQGVLTKWRTIFARSKYVLKRDSKNKTQEFWCMVTGHSIDTDTAMNFDTWLAGPNASIESMPLTAQTVDRQLMVFGFICFATEDNRIGVVIGYGAQCAVGDILVCFQGLPAVVLLRPASDDSVAKYQLITTQGRLDGGSTSTLF